ncbi:hypothetical protein DIPPA_13232 [Diplonema papillatum]|nr:hypothetical protein DIPPA_35701 [Diplonema papillatum]KAJ9439411.1 hypothetical protein DIPPA_05464 [Diplonema papillatum]KAJ9445845.1 hypothetical protein DIPPA_28793 [Diplonema papillatum]KAJ9449568.1 hypothetical protein DIPPA_08321 [Diplonema papillatum]KAJ9455772.1 hypothetical protein DIPPA_04556 [Diplonema papillatum]
MAEECPHCGGSFDPKGLATHKKACGQRALAALQATASASSSRAGTPVQSPLALPGSVQGKRRRADGEEGEPQEAVRDLEEKTAQTFGQASQKVAEHDVRLQMMEAGNAEMKQMLSSLMGMVTGLSAGGMPQRSRALGFADLGEGARWPGIFPGPTRMEVLRVFETRFERVLCTGARPGAREQAKGQLANLETGFDYFSDPERPVGGSFGDVHMVAVVDRAIARLVALQFGEETGVKGGHAGMFEKALEEQDLPGPLAEAWKEAERQRARSKGTKSQSSGQWNRSTYVQPVTGGKIGYPTGGFRQGGTGFQTGGFRQGGTGKGKK